MVSRNISNPKKSANYEFLIAYSSLLLLSVGINIAFAFNNPGFVKSLSSLSSRRSTSSCVLFMGGDYGSSRSSGKYGAQQQTRSKRQERVGNLIRIELAKILQVGMVKRTDPIESTLLQKINVVNANVSPDLAQARITVSILGKGAEANAQKRRAYSWLVSSQKMIRHALAQRLSHMKGVPMLTFVLADVGAAVDVMALIDRVTKNKDVKRDLTDLGSLYPEGGDEYNQADVDEDGMLSGVQFGFDFDDEMADDEAWIDEDDDDDEDDEYLVDDEEEENEMLGFVERYKDDNEAETKARNKK